jgi:hypothetical protein
MSVESIHEEIFNNGYCKINDPTVFKYLEDLDTWEWINWKDQGLQLIKRNSVIETAITKTQELLADLYVKHLDNHYTLGGECEIVNGMDDATLSWHNDNIEGYNLCILLYCDSLDEDTGGDVAFRNITTKELTGGFFPKKYDISFMNHGPRFEHVVNPLRMDLPRRVALFNFNISPVVTG